MENKVIVDTDVLIVGAGPTGLTLACELARRGVRFRIVDKKEGLSKHSKASAIQAHTLEIFHFMGIAKVFQDKGIASRGTNFYKSNKIVVAFDYKHLQKSTLYPYVLMIPQSETERILSDHLHTYGKSVCYQQELVAFEQKQNYVLASLQSASQLEKIKAKYVVSCEGAKSFLRKECAISFLGSTYAEIYLAADVSINWSLDVQKFHGWFHRDGLFGAGALPNKKQWRLFANMSVAEYVDKQNRFSTVEIIKDFVKTRLGYKNIQITQPTWEAAYKVNCRMANQYRKGNVFLAGDAAHIHSPVGGQGMNTGIQDAYNLAWKLACVLQQNAPSSLLDSYESERLPLAKWVLQRTHFITKIFTIKNSFIQFFREAITKILFSFAFIHNGWVKNSAQLDVHYRKSFLSKNHTSQLFSKLKAGNRFPPIWLYSLKDKTVINVFDLLKSSFFLLLIITRENKIDFNHDILKSNNIDSIFISPNNQYNSSHIHHLNLSFFIDKNNIFEKKHHLTNALILVRPDGYIGFFSKVLDWQALAQYFTTNYGDL